MHTISIGRLLSDCTPYILPVFLIVDLAPVNNAIVPAAITIIEPFSLLSILLLSFLLLALYYIWHLRKQIIHINRTGKELKSVSLNIVNNISQEVRSPLNAIIGFSEQLSYTSLDNNQRGIIICRRKRSLHTPKDPEQYT